MTIIVETVVMEKSGSERRTARADFTAECEFPNSEGDLGKGIAGRAAEIGQVAAQLFQSIAFEDDDDESFLPPPDLSDGPNPS